MLHNVGIHLPSLGKQGQEPYELRCVFGYAMDGTDFAVLHSLARTDREDHPFGVLTPAKRIGCNWTNVVSLPGLELNISSMPSALAHNVPGGQRQVKLRDFLLAILKRILISSSRRKTNSRSRQGVYQ